MTPRARLANRPVRLSREVAVAVTREIITGAFLPGTNLPPEQALCAAFGVSRPVVREAIKLVERNGLVRVRAGEGTRVLPREGWNLLDPDVLRIAMETERSSVLRDDVVAMRADLEVGMLRRAAPKLTEDDFAALERQLDVIDTLGDSDALHNADREFHAILYRASGNEIARTIVLLLIAETRSVSYLGVPAPEEFRVANRAHRRIVALLRQGDLDEAADVLRRHITTQWMVDRTR
ncbi:FadR/GntR family transcriptional regulator [Actinacidiphila acididurans]|uniref:FadR family transcriptional regulator n=1 Tax=Actinacidiphila acididurans TaxID=2784346 RepID=A0ABS2TYC6_9ACTN|nr:FCD domain-containing protein [Actinacidiphila acididurans]MBM9507817.1 FadR family transcriptional regulator [Actinacidiphila acididurans]